MLLTYLPTVPGNWPCVLLSRKYSKLSRKLFMYTSDRVTVCWRVRISTQAQNGCQCGRSSEPLPKEWASKWQPWWSGNRYNIWVIELDSELAIASECLNSPLGALPCILSCKSKRNPAKWLRLSCICKYQGWQVCTQSSNVQIIVNFILRCFSTRPLQSGLVLRPTYVDYEFGHSHPHAQRHRLLKLIMVSNGFQKDAYHMVTNDTSPGCSENYCLMGTSQNSGAT